MKRAQESGVIQFHLHNIRDSCLDRYGRVDDSPYGGGEGMVLRFDVLTRALEQLMQEHELSREDVTIVFLSPQGRVWNQKQAKSFSESSKDLILICGHYEGVDERFIEEFVDQEISIGDYVLTGGEIPALVLAETIVRLIPGVVGNPDSIHRESFEGDGFLKYPQYTRPPVFRGRAVPEVLLSGNHQKINEWRLEQSKERTKKKRPDLL